MTSQIPSRWLRRKGTIEDFERVQLERIAEAHGLSLDRVIEKFGARPFLSRTDAWRAFVAKKGPNEELWSFGTPEGTPPKMHRCGFAIVHDGSVRDVFVTLMS